MRLNKLNGRLINVIIIVLFLSGCGTAMDSVRAWRQHGEEPAKIEVLLDRIDDLAKSLELVHQLLFLTRYEPGAQWIKELGLNDQKAAKIRSELEKTGPYADPDFVVPVARIYREHVRRVLASTRSAKSGADDHIVGALNKALNQGSIAASWSETRRIQSTISKIQVKRARAKTRLDAVKKKNKAQRKTLQKALDKIDADLSKLELQLKAESAKAQAALEQSDFSALKS
ncbi:MAG: hypothetical protein VYA30_07020, partial [Myxococcota bacterium]|nr:hypothetical protein [Myxococcota bacterium]